MLVTVIAPGPGATVALARDDQDRLVTTVTRPGRDPVTFTAPRDLGLIGG